MGDDSGNAVKHMAQLGFTATEAEVYVALLRDSPATGYRVATSIGKATANTYKALRSLADKGAALTEDGDGRLYRAVPPEELLDRCTRTFEAQRDAARSALERIGNPKSDTGVYRLNTRDQVLQRAREMIGRAEEVVLMVAFPAPLLELVPDIEAAAARGVDIGVKGYKPVAIDGVELIVSTWAETWLEEAHGEDLTIVVDAREHLVALLDGEDLLQGIWSASPFLSFAHHNGLAIEQQMTVLARAVNEGANIARVRELLELKRSPVGTPGHRRLKQSRKSATTPTSSGTT